MRALHRDLGYLAVGLTVVYAVSGLAVNHIEDWDPNFRQRTREHRLDTALPADDDAAAAQVLAALDLRGPPREVFRPEQGKLEIQLDRTTLHVDLVTLTVREDTEEPRFFLHLANWLHLNRGKKAWTYVADAYAAGLLVLALSGLFMLPGRKGLLGRGAVLVGLGALVPVLYVALAGGP